MGTLYLLFLPFFRPYTFTGFPYKSKTEKKKKGNAMSIPRVIYLCDFIYNKNKNFFRILCHKTIIIVQEDFGT